MDFRAALGAIAGLATSGYAYAYENFGYIKHVEAQHQFSRQQMAANIIGAHSV